MQRRGFLKLGFASAIVLGVAGTAVAWLQPGLQEGRLSPASRTLFRTVGGVILEGSLPAGVAARTLALQGLLDRVDGVVAALPPYAQAELSQLLALLDTAPGRMAVAGLATPWADASAQECQAALQAMRLSSVTLRQQAYHALHDIVNGAYFADPATWTALGYPGPIAI